MKPSKPAGAWIAGILVNRGKPDPIVNKNDRFSAVAMMRVKIPYTDSLAANRQRVMGGDGDRIQIAEPSDKSRAVEMLSQQAD
jgi:hypothetical protein